MTIPNIEFKSLFGWGLLRRKQVLADCLDAAGDYGLTSLIAACIIEGISQEEEIVSTVTSIGGSHFDAKVCQLLREHGEESPSPLWKLSKAGRYVPA